MSLACCLLLTLTLLNFLNGIVHLPFLEQFIINIRDVKRRIEFVSIVPGQTAQVNRLACLFSGDKAERLITFISSRMKVIVKCQSNRIYDDDKDY